jgi:hypothetical protein
MMLIKFWLKIGKIEIILMFIDKKEIKKKTEEDLDRGIMTEKISTKSKIGIKEPTMIEEKISENFAY